MTRTSAAGARNTGPRFFGDLRIADNRFLGITAPAIRLYGVEGATIENNLVAADSASRGAANFAGIELENSSGVFISGWNVEDPRIGVGVMIGARVDPGEKGVRILSAGKAPTLVDKRVTPAAAAP
jgi:hypothetical protein